MLLFAQSRSCFVRALFVPVVLLFWVAAPASAVIHQFTATGTVDFFDVPSPYVLDGPEPASGGETFTLTFDFDDQAPLDSGNGTTTSGYDPAISNLSFTLSTGDTLTVSSDGVLAAINGTSSHQWSFFVQTGAPGFSTTLPEFLSVFNEDTFEQEDFFLADFALVLLDNTQTVYSMAPPELIVPVSGSFASQFITIEWLGSGPTPDPIRMDLSISSLTSTSIGGPAPVPLTGGAGLLALAIGLGGMGTRWLRGRGELDS